MTDDAPGSGALHIADSTIYGHLWATEEIRALFDDVGRTAAWLEILTALADAQASVGLLPDSAARAIGDVDPEDLDLEEVAAETRATGHSTLGLIRCLRQALPSHAREWVYYGATVQDLTDTWTALTMRRVTDLLVRDLTRLEDVAADLAARHRDTVMCGRTHAQPGLPITFGFKAAVWAAEIARHRRRLEGSRARREVVQLGGALGTMEFWGEQALPLLEEFAVRLDLRAPDIPWLTARDGVAEFVWLLALAAATVAKIGNEVMELQRAEIGEVREGRREGLVGSITMPHKRNPEISEQLDTLARVVRADATLALEGVVHLHERDARAWKAEWAVLPEACAGAAAAVAFGIELLEGLEVDAERMAANVAAQEGYVMSEPVMRLLADRIGKHSAHEVVFRAAMEGVAKGMSLREALLSDPTVGEHLDPADLDGVLDPESALGAARAFVDRVLGARGDA